MGDTHDRRFDVLAGLPTLPEGIRLGIMVAMCFGTHGQSFTRTCGPAVRTKVFPLGLPDLTPTQSPPPEMGNQLVLYLLSCAWHFICGGISLA